MLSNNGIILIFMFSDIDCHAATQIMLDEGYEIRFEGGRFDADRFNMQVTNLEVLKNDERQWSAAAISLKSYY